MMKAKNLLLSLSLLGNILLVALILTCTRDKDSAAFVSLFDMAHDRHVSQFQQLPVQPGDIVFLGDSITAGGLWPEWFADLPVRNRGIGGDTSAGILKRLEQVSAGQPAKVFLLIGTNDLAQGISPSTITDNIVSIVTRLQQDSPNTRVYVQSLLPRASHYRQQIETLNTLLEPRLSDRACWINLYPLFLDRTDGSIRNDLSNDELHLLGGGYLLWRNAIMTEIHRPTSDSNRFCR